MYTNRYNIILGLGALVSLASCESENNSTDDSVNTNDRVESENMRDNDGDDSTYDKSTLDQSESSSAIAITAEIRRAIVEDDRMSINAQNSKIITEESGLVTLRGVVNSNEEKNAIDAIANGVTGVTRVDNQLEVNTD